MGKLFPIHVDFFKPIDMIMFRHEIPSTIVSHDKRPHHISFRNDKNGFFLKSMQNQFWG